MLYEMRNASPHSLVRPLHSHDVRSKKAQAPAVWVCRSETRLSNDQPSQEVPFVPLNALP